MNKRRTKKLNKKIEALNQFSKAALVIKPKTISANTKVSPLLKKVMPELFGFGSDY